MKLVETLVVRDEADIVDAQLAYHLNAGVDFVLATDHESDDGTTEILERYERDGYLRRFRETGPMLDSAWRTRMARLAATEHRADWVINTDADEFWVPRRGTLKDMFAAVPVGYGVVWALTRPFVPRPDEGQSFAEQMTVRLFAPAPINDPISPYRPHAKAAHRGDPEIVVRFGSHIAHSPSLVPLRDWYPADVLHFPFRSREQYERKGVRRAHGDKPLGQYVRAYEAREGGRVDAVYASLVVGDEEVGRGLEAGSLLIDTRLRDALRALQAEPSGSGAPDRSGPSAGGAVDGELCTVAEGASLRDADLVRMQRRLDELDARVVAVGRRLWARGGRTRGR